MKTRVTEMLGLPHPIIQAPLAGGGDTPALVAAVCDAGGLGSIGATYLTPQQIIETCAAVRASTQRPFGINLFVPEGTLPDDIPSGGAIARVATFYEELGLPRPEPPPPVARDFDAQLDAALGGGASLFSFTFGMLPLPALRKVKTRGLTLAGTATTVDEAIALERAGVDIIVAQGSEAGGHRGSFAEPVDAAAFERGMIGTLALVPQIVDAVRVPVVASGGIMDGRGIAAALALGASGAQLGTAFLTCEEAGVPDAYKQAIMDAHEDQTRITRAFSGRPARGIVNRFMREVEAPWWPQQFSILPFPLQNALTRPLRAAAAKQGRAEFLSLWAGQGIRMSRRMKAADLVATLVRETEAAITRLHRSAKDLNDPNAPNDPNVSTV
jgi:nitronate monooxygenase